MTEQQKLIEEAMETIASLPCGGIGPDGPALADLNAASATGRCLEGDANYHIGQTAYRLLEAALAAGEKP